MFQKRIETAVRQRPWRMLYVPVRVKLVAAMVAAFGWCGLSTYLALPWINELAVLVTLAGAWFAVVGIALLPGLASSFVLAGLVLDSRPYYHDPENLPAMSVLIAAYNEESCIIDTLESLAAQNYPAPLEVLVIDDGSVDATAALVSGFCERMAAQSHPAMFRLISAPSNGGKASALNLGLQAAGHEIVATVDADSYLYRNALINIAANLWFGPPNTAAVAGSVLARNSRRNLITRLQEWDYFHGIAIVKRTQSLFQGTLVAQGDFSVYRRDVLKDIDGWPATVGEDIVLTWHMLYDGYRVGYAENAFVFTNVPETVGAYYRQRKRWARGLIEAFKRYPGILVSRA